MCDDRVHSFESAVHIHEFHVIYVFMICFQAEIQVQVLSIQISGPSFYLFKFDLKSCTKSGVALTRTKTLWEPEQLLPD